MWPGHLPATKCVCARARNPRFELADDARATGRVGLRIPTVGADGDCAALDASENPGRPDTVRYVQGSEIAGCLLLTGQFRCSVPELFWSSGGKMTGHSAR